MKTMIGGPCQHYDCSNRNGFGYCRTTVCINERYRQEQWGLPLTINKSESVVKKPQTHANRIRAMTDEELANWYFSEFFPNAPYCNKLECYRDSPCEQCLLDWLRTEDGE